MYIYNDICLITRLFASIDGATNSSDASLDVAKKHGFWPQVSILAFYLHVVPSSGWISPFTVAKLQNGKPPLALQVSSAPQAFVQTRFFCMLSETS